MSVNRLILLVVVLGGLILFIAQNWSVLPPLPLVLLGMQTQPLPLSVWILVSTAAGAIAYELIGNLLRLPNFPERQETFKSSTIPKTKTSTRTNSQRYSSTQTESRTERSSPPPPKSPTKNKSQEYEDYDDWDNAGDVDDWDFEDEREEASSYQETEVRDANTPRSNRAAKSSYDSDSTYSYNSHEPQNSGVGKTESIYDADYRVIASPYQSSTYQSSSHQSSSTNQFDEEDDSDEWDFLEDDDFEVEDKRPQK